MDGPGPDVAAPRADRRTRGSGGVLVDAAVAGAVFVYNLPVQGLLAGAPSVAPAEVLVPVGLCAPWVLRRARPVTALAVMSAAAVLQAVIGLGPLVADVMLALGVFGVARRHAWPVSVPALGWVLAWVWLALGLQLEEHGLDLGDLLGLAAVTVAGWLGGTLGRTRAAYVASLRERLAQAEREQRTRAWLATVAERTRIARELHDVVSHHLTAISLLSEGAAATAVDDPVRAAGAMRTVRDTSRTAMTEMRSLLSVLRGRTEDPAPPAGVTDLPELVERVRSVGVPATLRVEGEAEDLPAGASLAVYRIVQEALTNVRRHAGPDVRRTEVVVRLAPDEVVVRVWDDGRGPSAGADQLSAGGGQGLLGMQERVVALGGTLEAAPGPVGGFQVTAMIPRGGQ